MSKRMAKILAGLVVLPALAACEHRQTAYTGPGWYLERPRPTVTLGPEIFKGPFSYDQCEIERKKLPPTVDNLICNRELAQPGPLGGS